MRKVILAILAIMLYLFAGYVLPITLVGYSKCVTRIRNPHHVRVIVFDGSREVLNVSYLLKPHDTVSYGRSFGWYPKPTFTLITWAGGRYKFVVSTENDTLSHEFDVHPWKTIRFVVEKGGRIGWRAIVV